MIIYLIGSLRNPRVPIVSAELRQAGFEVFDDWFAAGPEADDFWQEYEQARKHSFTQALEGYHANDVYEFDKRHLNRADAGVLVLPAGKSCHLELGYIIGQDKPGFILLEDDDPERWDIMYRFAQGVYGSTSELLKGLKNERRSNELLFKEEGQENFSDNSVSELLSESSSGGC